MIIPSIDLMNGKAVQLIGGREKALEVDDPIALARKFSRVGEIAVIDLDAALGQGSNAEIIEKIIEVAPCRVGGGIRDLETAKKWLNAGANKIIIGTRATPEFLSQLPKDRLIAAVDAENGEVMVEGWRKSSGNRISEKLIELGPYVSEFLVTFIETEGRLCGVDVAKVAELAELVPDQKLTVAGGIASVDEIAEIDRLGVDSQIGMAIYTGELSLGAAFCAPLKSDRADGLIPTVVCDESQTALGLVYSSLASIERSIELGTGVYESRTRGIWEKGKTSGATQELLRIEADCDRDALRFVVRQAKPGFCHEMTKTCWGEDQGFAKLLRRLEERRKDLPENSYTTKLLSDPSFLRAKLVEEADELATANNREEVIWEAADLFYFAFVRMARSGVSLSQVEAELERRSKQV